MVFPKNNLATTVQPWAREVEKRVVNIESAAIKNEVNNVARDAQLALSYRRLDTAVKDIKTITDSVFTLSTEVDTATTLATDASTGVTNLETNVYATGTTQINGYNIKAGTINANAINAGTLTGFTIQTASSGTRIVMGGSTIDIYYGVTKVGVLSGTAVYGTEVSLLSPGTYYGLYVESSSAYMRGPSSFVSATSSRAEISGGGSNLYASSGSSGSNSAFSAPSLSAYNGYVYGSSGSLRMQSDGTGDYAQISSVYNRTYTAAANMYVNSNSTIGRATSASKYKLAIEEKTGYDFSKILELKPKSWFDKGTSELYAQYLSDLHEGKTPKEMADNEPLERINGLIAEDLVAAGLDDYVSWGPYKEDGTREPEGIQYDRLWTLLIPLVKELTNRVTILENK